MSLMVSECLGSFVRDVIDLIGENEVRPFENKWKLSVLTLQINMPLSMFDNDELPRAGYA